MTDGAHDDAAGAGPPKRARRPDPRLLVGAALAAWALGLVVAAFQLQAWQEDLGRVLLQMRADALLRASVVRDRETVAPQWYRERALALLPAVERLRDNTSWTLVIPGSWQVFDDLQARAAQRVNEAFAQVVVQTVHRELQGRASALAGVALPATASAGALPSQCATPLPPRPRAGAVQTLTIEELPEYAAMTSWLDKARQLDEAAAALRALATPGAVQPESFRMLVHYSLGADVSGGASRSLALFQSSLVTSAAGADKALAQQLRWAAHCSARRGMQALHARLLARSDILSTEEALRRAGIANLFDSAAADNGVAQIKLAHALIDEQDRLLSRAQPVWLHAPAGAASLGPAHEQLLARLQAVTLLGTASVADIRAEAKAEHAKFRARFAALFGRPGSGLTWQPGAGRFVMSPERAALRNGVSALLREPFMADDTPPPPLEAMPGVQRASLSTAPNASLEDVVALAEQRRLFVRDTLPRFAPAQRPAVARFVDERLAQLAHARTLAFARAAPMTTEVFGAGAGVVVMNGPGFFAPVDTPQTRLAAVDAALSPLAPSMAARLRARLAHDWQTTPPAVDPQQMMGINAAPR